MTATLQTPKRKGASALTWNGSYGSKLRQIKPFDNTMIPLGKIVVPRGEKAMPSEYPDLPYIGLEHIEAHSTKLLGSVSANEMRSTAKRFYSGDVLYSRLRPYLNKVWQADRDGLCSSEFIVLPGNDEVDANFLRYRLNASDFVSFANSLNAGDRPRVDFEQISSFCILPFSLAQQREIVAEIEKQFTRLEAGVTALKRVQANLKRYRAAVLKFACEGKLVPSTHDTWEKGVLGDVLAKIETGKSFKCEERTPRPEEIGVVKVSAVTWGIYNEAESKTCHDPNRIEEGYLIRPHDFLFSRANTIQLIGACVIAQKVTLKVMLSDKILRLRFTTSVDPKWVLYWLRSDFARKEIERLATGNQESMRNIGQERIKQIRVSFPPLAEQKRIVEEVERRFSVIDELESVVKSNLQRATRLRQSILQKAFTGELPG